MHLGCINNRTSGSDNYSESAAASDNSYPRFFLSAIVFGFATTILARVADVELTVTSFFLQLFICGSFILASVLLGCFCFLAKKGPVKMCRFNTATRTPTHLSDLINKIMRRRDVPPSEPGQARHVVISHSMDKALREVFDYCYRDYVLSWYAPLSRDEGQLYHMLSEGFWEVAGQLRSRLANLDVVSVVCNDVVKALHTHFCDLKAADGRRQEVPRPFPLHPCLRSPAEERHFLHSCARLLLLRLLPSCQAHSRTLRTALADLLTTKVLQPLVEVLSEPDYINRTVLAHLEQRQQLGERHREACAYTPSYQEFVRLIAANSDIHFLKQLRYQIVVEIIQATTLSSLPQLKKQKDGRGKETPAVKTDLLRACNMKRYVNQLTVARRQCESRIRALGGPHYGQREDQATDEPEGPEGQRIVQFEEIMSNPVFREYFGIYMERLNKRALVSFWELVETLKSAHKSEVPQLVGEIYQSYFVEGHDIAVDKARYKEIQQSLVGNKGTDVFLRIQSELHQTMKECYYPPFLVSELYERIARRQEQGHNAEEAEDETYQVIESGDDVLDADSNGINDQASYAASRLQRICDKLEYKRQALGIIQNSPKPDKKMVSKLTEEIGAMEKELSELQLHVSRTDWWCENLGRWRAVIGTGEAVEENGEQVPSYCVTVSLQEEDLPERSCWTVCRRLGEFQVLHRKLVECLPYLKKVQLPSLSKLPFKSIDQKFLEKSKNQLNTFLQTVLTDERLCQSESLYAFLSPSPEQLKIIEVQKKTSFSLASFLEKLPGDFFSHPEGEADDDSDFSDYGDEGDSRKDDMAEPCFALMGEIFELRGMFKWVRKTLIALVQVTFGRTINRQIRDSVSWIFSEQMLVYYVNLLRDSFWPDGVVATRDDVFRSDSERHETRERAREKLLDNIPDALQNLVGQQNARQGVLRVFDALQEVGANRHLLYITLEILIRELCPELGQEVD